MGEGGAIPVGRAEDDGDDARLLRLVSRDSLLHLNAVAELGGHEVGADEQENEMGFVEVCENLFLPFGARGDIAIVPIVDEALSSQVGEMGSEFVSQGSIFVRVGNEDVECHLILLLIMRWLRYGYYILKCGDCHVVDGGSSSNESGRVTLPLGLYRHQRTNLIRFEADPSRQL